MGFRINRSFPNWQTFPNGVPHTSKLDPILFMIFLSDLDDGMKQTLMHFANDTKLCGEADTLEGRTYSEGRSGQAGKEGEKKITLKVHKHKCKALNLGKLVQHRLGSTWLGTSSVKRDLYGKGPGNAEEKPAW